MVNKVRKYTRRVTTGIRGALRFIRAQREGRKLDRLLAGMAQPSLNERLAEGRNVFRDLFKLKSYFRQMNDLTGQLRAEFCGLEPLLKIAGMAAPSAYEWEGDLSVRFPDHELPGHLHAVWDGRVHGSHAYTFNPLTREQPFYEVRMPRPGKIRGRARRGNAVSADDSVSITNIIGLFEEGFPGHPKVTGFSAHSLEVKYSPSTVAFSRYLYLGISLRGWRDMTLRMEKRADGTDSINATRDSFDTLIFEKRARITQVVSSEIPSEQIIGVTVAGEPLSVAEQDVLWHVLSFVAGGRAQPYAIEYFDEAAVCSSRVFLSGIEFGTTKSPPFDLRASHMNFAPATWGTLCEGFQRMLKDTYPLGVALHHLYEANSGYYQVEIKNLLFCIHTLFERWADINKQRVIVRPNRPFKEAARKLKADAERYFNFDGEALLSVNEAVYYANERGGTALQTLFFDSLGVVLTPVEERGLARRNRLFHRGFIKNDPTNEQELQEMLDEAGALRTLAHMAILKLSGYSGPLFDYVDYENRPCQSGYPRDA